MKMCAILPKFINFELTCIAVCDKSTIKFQQKFVKNILRVFACTILINFNAFR